MLVETAITLGVVGFTSLLMSIYLIRFVYRYKHEYESNPLCTSTVIICLLVTLVTTFLLPIDIFLVSFVKEADGSLKEWATPDVLASIDKIVFNSYYSLYGITMLLIFVIIPFLHFLNEESESNSRDRLHNSIKYTFAISVFATLLLIIGALVPVSEPGTIFDKIIHITDMPKFQGALNTVLAIITTAGFVNVSFYTASGIFSWPVGLLMGTSSVAQRVGVVNDRETILRIRIETLRERGRVDRLTPAEREQLLEAESELRDLNREQAALSDYNNSWAYRLRNIIRPTQIVFGSVLCLMSILLVATLVITNVDRLLHGAGPKQGYVLLTPSIFNPLDYVFTKLQDLTFIGPIPILVVTSFLVVATISGTRNLGLWFMFARLYRVKIGRTHPQALLFFCMTIVLTATAFNLTLYSMTSEYVTFGDQKLRHSVNGTWISERCTFQNYQKDCLMTRCSILLMRMMSQVWVFGTIFYWTSWSFVLVATVSLFAYLIRGKRAVSRDLDQNQDEFED